MIQLGTLPYVGAVALAKAVGVSTAGLSAMEISNAIAQKIQENPKVLNTPQAKGIAFAMGIKLPGVFAPDAEEMEKEAERIKELTKPIGFPGEIISEPIKTGETTPPKIETTETLPIEDKLLPQLPGFGEGKKIDIPIIFNMKDGKPEFKYPTEEEIKEYINEDNQFWKKNLEKANKENPQYNPKNMPQVVEADKHFGAAAYIFQNYDESKLIYMSPDEYLSLTKEYRSEEGKESTSSKVRIKNLENILKEGGELANIPILYVNKPFEDSDSFEVVGQEGNHRAKAFKNLGYDKIPVVIEGSTREIRQKIKNIFPTNIFSFSNYNKDKKKYEQYDSVLTKLTDFYDVLTKEKLFVKEEDPTSNLYKTVNKAQHRFLLDSIGEYTENISKGTTDKVNKLLYLNEKVTFTDKQLRELNNAMSDKRQLDFDNSLAKNFDDVDEDLDLSIKENAEMLNTVTDQEYLDLFKKLKTSKKILKKAYGGFIDKPLTGNSRYI